MWLDSTFRVRYVQFFFCFWPGNDEFAPEGTPVLVRVGMPLCPGCARVCRIQAAGGQAHGSGLPRQPPAKVEAESKRSLILTAKAVSAATFFPLIVSALSFLLLEKLLWLICAPLFPPVFWLHHAARVILLPPPGTEPTLPVVGVQCPNQWTTRHVPTPAILFCDLWLSLQLYL